MQRLPRISVWMSAAVAVAALCGAVAVLAAIGTFSGSTNHAGLTAEQRLHNHVRAGRRGADSRYQLATARLLWAEQELSASKQALRVARRNLAIAQKTLAQRLVSLYTSRDSQSSLAVIAGAKSLDDLINRLATLNRVGA